MSQVHRSSVTSVSASAASTTILAANPIRYGATIYNDSAATLWLAMGETASMTSFSIEMMPESYFEVPYSYTGVINGIWSSATGAARVTEYT
jgi:hypothetical protein